MCWLTQFWLGSAPIVFILSGVTAAYAYVTMPVPRSDSEVLQIWLQARFPRLHSKWLQHAKSAGSD